MRERTKFAIFRTLIIIVSLAVVLHTVQQAQSSLPEVDEVRQEITLRGTIKTAIMAALFFASVPISTYILGHVAVQLFRELKFKYLRR